MKTLVFELHNNYTIMSWLFQQLQEITNLTLIECNRIICPEKGRDFAFMPQEKTFYITTPIYYPSGKMHIGHTYTTVAADTMARFKKLTGYKTFFLTGTDEHGQKIEKKAKEAGETPKEYVDAIVEDTKELWKLMDIEYNDFIRTTDERHIKVVQKIFRRLFEQGDIYKGKYEGQYCMQCEAFWTKTQLLEGGLCPDCGRPTELVEEESYFFKTSKYQDWLIDYIEKHPEFIQPVSRANEMLNNFLRPGLQDLAVSRTSFKWGVPVDFDDKHVIYVWIDALSNYLTALGYGTDNDELMRAFWPPDVQLVGKEIVRFHTIYWPILLHALDLPLPKQVFAHGWLLFGNDKMSKSKGNVAYPQPIIARYGADALRYYLMREMPFGADGNYTNESLINRINSDLANDFGNLLSRSCAMIEKYFDGVLPAPSDYLDEDKALIDQIIALPGKAEQEMDKLQFSQALTEIWRVISELNRYIDITKPWILGKNPDKKERLGTVLYVLAEGLRFIAALIQPFMPNTPEKIFEQIGAKDAELWTWESLKSFGGLKPGGKVYKKEALFPRLDVEKELKALNEENEKLNPAKKQAHSKPENKKPIVSIQDFEKLDIKTAEVLECKKVPKSDKLLQFKVSLGDETRTIVSGIASYYKPEELVGKKLVIIANLEPRKIFGIESQGMILSAASDDGSALSALTVLNDVPGGSVIN